MRVLVTAPYFQPVLDRFRSRFEQRGIDVIVPTVAERLDEEELMPLVGDIDGAICGDDRFTERVLAAAPRLKVLAKWGTGIDSIDLATCRRRGIKVCNTPNAFSEPVADSVLGYILCFARRLPWMDCRLKKGEWSKEPSVALHECTLGIVGVGNVGRAVARRAVAFGMRVLGNDPAAPPAELIASTGLVMTDLATLLGASDFVSVNCDLNPTSRGLLGSEALSRMKATAVLINTARGPIVVEHELEAALRGGRLAGAALDVFEREPLPASSSLRTMNNVMLAPHNANSSPEAWERVHENTLRDLFSALEDRR